MKATNVTEQTFDQTVLASAQPVLVDFWAPWCGPCLQLAPVIDQIATENEGRVTVAKVNIDEAPQLAAKFGIRSIPTLLYFKDGAVRDQVLGAVPKRVLVEKLNALAEPQPVA
jgi:thioredoxin 1